MNAFTPERDHGNVRHVESVLLFHLCWKNTKKRIWREIRNSNAIHVRPAFTDAEIWWFTNAFTPERDHVNVRHVESVSLNHPCWEDTKKRIGRGRRNSNAIHVRPASTNAVIWKFMNVLTPERDHGNVKHVESVSLIRPCWADTKKRIWGEKRNLNAIHVQQTSTNAVV